MNNTMNYYRIDTLYGKKNQLINSSYVAENFIDSYKKNEIFTYRNNCNYKKEINFRIRKAGKIIAVGGSGEIVCWTNKGLKNVRIV